MLASTAAMITAATSAGRDSCGTWLVGSVVVVAPIFLARARSRSGEMMRSLALTMYLDGRVLHAATVP